QKLLELKAPDIIVRNEKRMLQEAVDALIDNGRRGRPVTGPGNRALKSLSAFLRGKQGRFRMNLLGKRVDYSGRSVIVVGPELKIYQCGLPKEMAIELFKPFVMKKLVENGTCHNIKSAKRTVERMKPCVWDILEEIIKDHPVLLNRAPTLHRLSIQAFEPVLIEGRAIKLHPLVCGAFNADFDGDQMAVHVPLSIEAQAEARFLMLSSNNILKLSDGKPVMSPTQDMVLGCYYLTIVRKAEGRYYVDDSNIEFSYINNKFYILKEDEKGRRPETVNEDSEEFTASNVVYGGDGEIESCTLTSVVNGKVYENVKKYKAPAFISEEEAIMAYQTKQLTLQDEIYVRRTVTLPNGESITGRVKTTCGRIIFNEQIPQDIGFTKRVKDEDYLKYEIDKLVAKNDLKKIVDACFKKKSAKCAAETLDYIKSLGYKYSTVGAITTSIFDMHVPEKKQQILDDASSEVLKIEKRFNRGQLTEDERYKAVVNVWTKATSDVTNELKKTLDKFNPIWMMANSGARGSIDQIKQLSGMRGLMTDPSGRVIEIPVKSCFREGLTVLEYFTSSHGGRKGLTDTALKTADSGYLTRRLVDVSHSVIVKEEDCFVTLGESPKGIEVSAIRVEGEDKPIEELKDRLSGRFTINDVINPTTGEVIVAGDTMISEEKAEEIQKAGIEKVLIRSVFSCRSKVGVCAKCYGKNMSSLSPVQIGEAVGTIAAQSIGEPGTQLTMRTFHTGGIASTGDITQGLPRIEELFEARKPNGQAVLCDVGGKVSIEVKDGLRHVVVKNDKNTKSYQIPFSAEIKVKEGDIVEPGTILTSGSVYPQEILTTKGVKGVEDYILKEVQRVYRSQGVDINDKHVEIIVRQMLRKVLIQASGDTSFLPGEYVDEFVVREENKRVIENGGRPAMSERVLLGITKASLATESFLSAASFQETTRVLTDAAIKNKVDHLVGLKENIIIGKLIPAGTGAKEYKNLLPQANSTTQNV
ncbi:MAG: DNA-directed RNA polymerase subunit beta', partial [Clostridia bacterium]|nr:DNA-directed RNA polymerase subunit beta' [Clostridia bacterium]